MSETKPIEGEVVPETVQGALVKSDISSMVKEADRPLLNVMEAMSSMNWRELTPPQLALLIMQKPFAAQGGGQMFLSFKQAMLFAVRCYELNLSPFSSQVWFDANRGLVNLTLEGKRELLRNKNIDVGPPNFEEKTREWNELPRSTTSVDDLKKAGFPRDQGVVCKMRVGNPAHQEFVTYTAWLSEWYVGKSPVWQAKPIHMLQTRATEKAISLVMGTGASDPVD